MLAAGACEDHSADFRIASQLASVINERKPMLKYTCVGRPNLKLSGVTNSGSKNPVFGYKIAVACVTQYVAANPAVARTASRRSDVFRHAKKIVSSESNTDMESVWPV